MVSGLRLIISRCIQRAIRTTNNLMRWNLAVAVRSWTELHVALQMT